MINGRYISVKVGSAVIQDVTNCVLSFDSDTITYREVAQFESKLLRKKKIKVDVTGYYSNGHTQGVNQMATALLSNTLLYIIFGDIRTGGNYYAGWGYVTSCRIGAANNSATEVNISFEFSNSVARYLVDTTPPVQPVQQWSNVYNEPFTDWTGTAPDESPDNFDVIFNGARDTDYRLTNDSGKCKFINNCTIEQSIETTPFTIYRAKNYGIIRKSITIGAKYRISFDVTAVETAYSNELWINGNRRVATLQNPTPGNYSYEFFATGETLDIVHMAYTTEPDNVFITIDNYLLEIYS